MFDKGEFSVYALYNARKNNYRIKYFDNLVFNLWCCYSNDEDWQRNYRETNGLDEFTDTTQDEIDAYIAASGGIKEFDTEY